MKLPSRDSGKYTLLAKYPLVLYVKAGVNMNLSEILVCLKRH